MWFTNTAPEFQYFPNFRNTFPHFFWNFKKCPHFEKLFTFSKIIKSYNICFHFQRSWSLKMSSCYQKYLTSFKFVLGGIRPKEIWKELQKCPKIILGGIKPKEILKQFPFKQPLRTNTSADLNIFSNFELLATGNLGFDPSVIFFWK